MSEGGVLLFCQFETAAEADAFVALYGAFRAGKVRLPKPPRPKKRRAPWSAERRAKMQAAWARRRSAQPNEAVA
jgi:hypothetical protein